MKTQHLTFLVAVICSFYAVIIVYSNHFENGFHFDDFHTIVNNPSIRSLQNIPSFFKDATTFSIQPSNQSYRPITTLSLALDYALAGGYAPFFYHFSTFITFLLQSVCIFLLMVSILKSGDNRTRYVVSLLCTLFYSLHPAIAETVNYVIARSDVQSTFAVVLALLIYIKWPGYRHIYLYLIPVLLGALAKPPALMFLPILFAYVLLIERGGSFKNLKSVTYSLWRCIPSGILFVIVYAFIEYMTPETWVGGGADWLQYLQTQPFVIFHYFSSFFLPVGLSADTDWGIIPLHDLRFLSGIAFLAATVYFIINFSAFQRYRVTVFGLCWFLFALVPTSSIFPLAEVLNDHRMFFPFIGLTISLAQELIFLWERFSKSLYISIPITTGALAILVIMGIATYRRNEIWLNEKSLWYNVSQVSPGNPRGLMNYGLVLMNEGQYDKALNYFMNALTKAPAYAVLWINIGVANAAKGLDAEAQAAFLKAINYRPDHASYFFYGRFLFERARYSEAEDNLKKSVSLSPAYLDPRYLLMEIYQREGKKSDLSALIQSTLLVSPDDQTAAKYADDLSAFNRASTTDTSKNKTPLHLLRK